MPVMIVVPLLFFVVLIIVLVGVLAPPNGYPTSSPPAAPMPGLSAVQILDASYARNEISREEYLRKKVDLVGSQSPAP